MKEGADGRCRFCLEASVDLRSVLKLPGAFAKVETEAGMPLEARLNEELFRPTRVGGSKLSRSATCSPRRLVMGGL